MNAEVRRKKFAVLYALDGEESRPIGLVIERADHVEVIAPPERCFPYRIDDAHRTLLANGEMVGLLPGDPRYFNAALNDFVYVCAVGHQGEYGDPIPTPESAPAGDSQKKSPSSPKA